MTRRNAGFTLIELSMVIFIVGLILGMGTAAWRTFKTSQSYAKAKAQLEMAEACLLEGAIPTGHIPSATWFNARCAQKNPWGYAVQYHTACTSSSLSCALKELSATKTFIQYNSNGETETEGIVWLLSSKIRNRKDGDQANPDNPESGSNWQCDTANALCRTISKSRLYYEIH